MKPVVDEYNANKRVYGDDLAYQMLRGRWLAVLFGLGDGGFHSYLVLAKCTGKNAQLGKRQLIWLAQHLGIFPIDYKRM